MAAVDLAALVVLALALARGAWLGVVREVFSIAALVAGIAAARFLGPPAGEQMAALWSGGPGVWVCQLVAGAVLGIACAIAVGLAGRILKRGLHAAGLGAADRFAGGALGLAEGALFVGLAIWLGVALLGREHPELADTESLRAFEVIENWVLESDPEPRGTSASRVSSEPQLRALASAPVPGSARPGDPERPLPERCARRSPVRRIG